MRWLETTTFLGVGLFDWLFAGRTATGADDLVLDLTRRTRTLLLFIPSLYVGFLTLYAFPQAARLLRGATILAVLLQVAMWASVAIDFWVAREKRRRLEQDVTTATLI